ncbi:MAG TPA: class I SAM-dependent methyltransferase [Gemmataceae bacterium]|jgi:predicted O-methyltransferase YrrM|nr:class I SAM-dependent methyltransferase [Gemmataceae bacterium]
MKTAVCCSYFRDGLVEALVEDLKAWAGEIHLWALEAVLPAVAPWTRGSGALGKFQALNRLLAHVSDVDLVLFVDDDVRLPGAFLPNYTGLVRRLRAAVAQPALTADSYYSHPITLERKGCWARLTNFVESGPVVSMTRDFLGTVTPFPESNPMGWGLDIQWSARARTRGLDLAIIDACPVAHSLRPVGDRYNMGSATEDMLCFLAENGLDWPEPAVLREYRRVYDRREDYLAAFPAPAEAVAHGTDSDAAQDLPLLWAVAALVRPELVVELGTRWGKTTRTLVHAVRPWDGTVVTADPVNAQAHVADLPCQFVHMDGEELFRVWSTPVPLLFIDTDPHSYRQTRRWLDTWVTTWLADGGVAVFHDVVAARPEIQVAQAVRDWLREQPRIWHWQEFAGTSGLGLLWRLGDRPEF